MKLKAKFILIISGVMITIFAATAYFTFSSYRESIKKTISQQQFLMVSIFADEIDNRLLTAQQHLVTFAKIVPHDIMKNTEKAQALLDSREDLRLIFDNHLFLFTPEGKIFVESPYIPGRRGLDLSFRDYIKKTTQTKKPYISDPFISSQSHKHASIMMTVPLFGHKGELTGILTGSIDLMKSNFMDRISTVKVGKTGNFYLYETDGTMIMHPNKKRILLNQPRGLNKLYDMARDGFEGTGETTTSYGLKAVTSFKRLKTKDWILAANYPQAEAYLPIRKAEEYFLIATVAGIAAIFLITLIVIRRLTVPLEVFTSHVRDIGQKEGDDRFLNINTKDEIGTLSSAFNTMIATIDHDIAERKKAEIRLFRANRALNAINRCDEAITHVKEETNLLDEVCKIIVETGGYRMCWVGYAERDEAKTVRPVAQKGYEDSYLQNIQISWDDTEYGRGPAGTAIRTGKASIFNNITTDPDFSPWRKDALNLGYGSILGLPLNTNSDTFGALTIYAAEPNAFNEDEVMLLTSLSDNLAYGIMTLRTLTEQKKAEKASIQSEEKYRTLFEESKDAVFISTPEGRYLDINRAGIELLGYASKEELLAIDIARDLYVNPEDREKYEKMLHENGFTKDYEIEMKRKDGSKLTVLTTSSVVRDEKGSVTAYRGIMRDITEHKKLEEQFLQAQKMEAMGRLAGGIAHDFNNLMTAVIGYSDLVLRELPKKHFASDKIEIIKDAGNKASDLVRQLLAFSRNQMLEIKPVNLNEIVHNMNKIFERTIGEDIELELNIDKPVKNVSADAGQIEQVLMNLVVNARDAMTNGGRLIIETDNVYLDKAYSLMHSQLVKPGHYVMLSVTDNGAGMSPEIREKIFDPFFTTKGTAKGTGLGLSTTYGIVKQHNGYIWVYSEPDKGTTFKVYLPATEEEVKETRKAGPSITSEGTETILVVDDQPLIRQFVSDVLQPLGYKLYEADSAEEALNIAEQVEGRIDLLLTDLVMPGMRGSELGELFIERWPNTKVIIMSGYGDKEILYKEIKDAIFMQKPITAGELSAKLREVLDCKLN